MRLVECPDCNGSGKRWYISAEDEDARHYTCGRCGGTGEVCSQCSEAEGICECPEVSDEP